MKTNYGRKCDELHVDDESVWKWISLLIRDGLKEGAEVISKCQGDDR